MFTGIIKDLGQVIKLQKRKVDYVLTIKKNKYFNLNIGDSLAVNGCCLTVSKINKNGWSFQIMPETVKKTNLSQLQSNDKVNLEPPVKAQDLLSGHLVSGHIDEIGKIIEITQDKNGIIIQITYSSIYKKYLIVKGSVAVDGISLTIVQVKQKYFTVALIEETLKKTTLGRKQKNDLVNLEFDLIAKYLESIVKHAKSKRQKFNKKKPEN